MLFSFWVLLGSSGVPSGVQKPPLIEHSIFESRGFLLSLLGGGHKLLPLTSPLSSYTTLLVLFYFDLELQIANLES